MEVVLNGKMVVMGGNGGNLRKDLKGLFGHCWSVIMMVKEVRKCYDLILKLMELMGRE